MNRALVLLIVAVIVMRCCLALPVLALQSLVAHADWEPGPGAG
jgi:hypothetical protein